ncbi:MAG TPA: DUF362 domain-containing protein [Actinomycetota bacterium]|nr:DUF362 domain-containing protein [Actinomycetota bacterium]
MSPRRIPRREVLRGAAIASAGVALGGVGVNLLLRPDRPWDASVFAAPGRARVAVVHASSYEGLEAIVLDGLRAVGADLSGRSVLLKPNLVEYDASTAINTDPRLVAATVLAARRLGARSVVVGEGPGHRRDLEYVVTASGLLDVLTAVDAPFVDLNTAAIVRQPLHSSFTSLGELWLPAPVVEADVVVSMPKMKTHHWAGATLSMKNCFGCVPGRIYGWPKNVLHWAGLNEAIVDVAAGVRPELQIVDGIVGMEGNGPIQGTPVRAGLLVFGNDPVATDVTAASLMGLDPMRLPSIAEAARFLGQGDPSEITQLGEPVASNVHRFEVLPRFASLEAGSAPSSGSLEGGPA